MDATEGMVPAEEEIQEGSPPEVESAEVAPSEGGKDLEAELEQLRQELEREKKGRKGFQSEKDKLEARLKDLERADMDDKERLQAELEDMRVELQQEKLVNYQLYFEKVKREVAEEYKIPTRFHKYLYGRDEDELRDTARSLAADIEELGVKEAEEKAQEDEKPPFVPGGVPAPDIAKEYDELRKKGDIQGILKKRLFGRG